MFAPFVFPLDPLFAAGTRVRPTYGCWPAGRRNLYPASQRMRCLPRHAVACVMNALGFDVSQYQAGLDFQAAADSGMSFAFIRASSGAEVDPEYARHQIAVRSVVPGDAGVFLTGSYHALQPGISAGAQATTFYRALAVGQGFFNALPPALDVEKKGVDERLVHQFLEAFAMLWDRQMAIYTSVSKWHMLVGRNRVWAARHPLWVAHWDVEKPVLPTPWATWEFWQYTVGRVPFWPKAIDLDVYNGTPAELARRLGVIL